MDGGEGVSKCVIYDVGLVFGSQFCDKKLFPLYSLGTDFEIFAVYLCANITITYV